MARASASVSGFATTPSPMPSCTSTGFGRVPERREPHQARVGRAVARIELGLEVERGGVEERVEVGIALAVTPAAQSPSTHDARAVGSPPQTRSGMPASAAKRARNGAASGETAPASCDSLPPGTFSTAVVIVGSTAAKTPPMTPPSDWPR